MTVARHNLALGDYNLYQLVQDNRSEDGFFDDKMDDSFVLPYAIERRPSATWWAEARREITNRSCDA